MIKKIKNIFSLIFFFTFIILITVYYFSDENKNITHKSRNLYLYKLSNESLDLPLLENDTNDIIEYKDDIEIYIKKKKYYKFWDLINK